MLLTFLSVKFLSTLSLRRATICVCCRQQGRCDFYPRSPCGERQCARGPLRARAPISIHALLAESDLMHFSTATVVASFLSTLSLRRATLRHIFFALSHDISIHALLAESDQLGPGGDDARRGFLSTLSLRRATRCIFFGTSNKIISIHALLAESDVLQS